MIGPVTAVDGNEESECALCILAHNDGEGLFPEDEDCPFQLSCICFWPSQKLNRGTVIQEFVKTLQIIGLQGSVPGIEVQSYIDRVWGPACQFIVDKQIRLRLGTIPCIATVDYPAQNMDESYHVPMFENLRAEEMQEEKQAENDYDLVDFEQVVKNLLQDMNKPRGEPGWMLRNGLCIRPHGIAFMDESHVVIESLQLEKKGTNIYGRMKMFHHCSTWCVIYI